MRGDWRMQSKGAWAEGPGGGILRGWGEGGGGREEEGCGCMKGW